MEVGKLLTLGYEQITQNEETVQDSKKSIRNRLVEKDHSDLGNVDFLYEKMVCRKKTVSKE